MSTRHIDPQSERVLSILNRDGVITRLIASHYGIANLTARIADLRIRHGYNVRCTMKRDADGRRYGVWTMNPAVSA